MIVVPGNVIGKIGQKAEGSYYIYENYIISNTVALKETKKDKIKITPLSGIYIPKKGDLVIGKVIEVYPNGWLIDINSPYTGFLLIKDGVNEFIDITKIDLNDYYTYDDFIVAKVLNVMRNKIINLTTKEKGLGKLKEGLVISINPKKVPRVIGKNASMLQTIKQITNVDIIVGQNGRIWISGENKQKELIVAKAIYMIEKMSHTKGLTDKIKKFLEEEIKKLSNG